MKKQLNVLFAITVGFFLSACAPKNNSDTDPTILKKYLKNDGVNQILLVKNSATNCVATICFYEKDKTQGAWKLTLETEGLIGKNGMNKTREGDGKTPCGDFEITGAFGILPNPGTALAYRDIQPTTYACDEDCKYYNQIIDTAETGHACKGEEMYTIRPNYNYGLTVGYNPENKYPNGSAIFVHCKGTKPHTHGCIALNEEDMKYVLKSAQKGMRIYLEDKNIQPAGKP